MAKNDPAVAAIQFALTADEGMVWLREWNEGNFEACRREWPEAPEECYLGADPLLETSGAGESHGLTDERIDDIANAMPGGLDGFLKGWGWRQFARQIEEAVMERAGQPDDAMIDAASARAALYDDDDRPCIKTDVMNAFYAGAEFAMRASPAALTDAQVDANEIGYPTARYLFKQMCHFFGIELGGSIADALKLIDAKRAMLAASPAALTGEVRQALEAAREFITNGVALGYIRMPDADCPDPAHHTLPMIERVLAASPAALTDEQIAIGHRLHRLRRKDCTGPSQLCDAFTAGAREYKHLKTGGRYTMLGNAIMEATGAPVVVYRSNETGIMWVRPHDEFFDGRFEEVK